MINCSIIAYALVHGIEEDDRNIAERTELVQEGEPVGFQIRGRWRRGFNALFGNNFDLHFQLSFQADLGMHAAHCRQKVASFPQAAQVDSTFTRLFSLYNPMFNLYTNYVVRFRNLIT